MDQEAINETSGKKQNANQAKQATMIVRHHLFTRYAGDVSARFALTANYTMSALISPAYSHGNRASVAG